MKIKTIIQKVTDEGLKKFDQQVNDAIAEGWILGKRDVLPGVDLGGAYFVPHLYAELVMLDPEPEPEATDPLDLLNQVKAFCLSQAVEDCHANKFPLAAWCDQIREGCDPTDWILPEVDA